MRKNNLVSFTFLILITSLLFIGCEPKDKILTVPFYLHKKNVPDSLLNKYRARFKVFLHWENGYLYTKITIDKYWWYKNKVSDEEDSTDFKLIQSNYYMNKVSFKLISDKGYTLEKYDAYISGFKERDDIMFVGEYIFDKRPMQKEEYNSIFRIGELDE